MSDVDTKLETLLDEIQKSDDASAQKIAQHIAKINGLFASGNIDEATRNELLEDANQIIEVEKDALAVESKTKLEQVSELIYILIKVIK